MASGPWGTTAGLGSRGARPAQFTVRSTAPPDEVASARKGRKKPTPPHRVIKGVYPPLAGPGCAPKKRFGTPGGPPVTTGNEAGRARERRSHVSAPAHGGMCAKYRRSEYGGSEL
eukprot:9474464-Pyramimonas_sp.AAC.1